MVNTPTIKELVRTGRGALEGTDGRFPDLEYYSRRAHERLLAFAQESGEEKAATDEDVERVPLSVDVHLRAPILFVPRDIFDPDTLVARLDLGWVSARAALQPSAGGQEYLSVTEESDLYDTYRASFWGLELSVTDPSVQSEPHVVLEDLNAEATFMLCLAPSHPRFPSLKVDVDLGPGIRLQAGYTLLAQVLLLKNELLYAFEDQLQTAVRSNAALHQAEKDRRVDILTGEALAEQEREIDMDDLVVERFRAGRGATFRKGADEIADDEEEIVDDQLEGRSRSIFSFAQRRRAATTRMLPPLLDPAAMPAPELQLVATMGALTIHFDEENLYCSKKLAVTDPAGLVLDLRTLTVTLTVERCTGAVDVDLTSEQLGLRERGAEDPDSFDRIIFPQEVGGKETGCDEHPQLVAKARIHISQEASAVGEVQNHVQVDVDVTLSQVILNANVNLAAKITENVLYGRKLVLQDPQNMRELCYQAREELLEALFQPDDASCTRKQQLARLEYRNLAQALACSPTPESIQEHLKEIITIIENVEYAALAEQFIRSIKLKRRLLPKVVHVILAQRERLDVTVKAHVKSLEVWANDFDRRSLDAPSETVVIKLGADVSFWLEELANLVTCSRAPQTGQPSQATIMSYLADDSLERLVRILESRITLSGKVTDFSVECVVVDAWLAARDVLLHRDLERKEHDVVFARTSILEPTWLAFTLRLDEVYQLKDNLDVEVELYSLSLSPDFKDLSLLGHLARRIIGVVEANLPPAVSQERVARQARVSNAIEQI